MLLWSVRLATLHQSQVCQPQEYRTTGTCDDSEIFLFHSLDAKGLQIYSEWGLLDTVCAKWIPLERLEHYSKMYSHQHHIIVHEDSVKIWLVLTRWRNPSSILCPPQQPSWNASTRRIGRENAVHHSVHGEPTQFKDCRCTHSEKLSPDKSWCRPSRRKIWLHLFWSGSHSLHPWLVAISRNERGPFKEARRVVCQGYYATTFQKALTCFCFR